MNDNEQSVEDLKAAYETELMEIDGIVAVSIGQCDDGSNCLMIGTSKPVDEVRRALPSALERSDVDLVFFGEIEAQ